MIFDLDLGLDNEIDLDLAIAMFYSFEDVMR